MSVTDLVTVNVILSVFIFLILCFLYATVYVEQKSQCECLQSLRTASERLLLRSEEILTLHIKVDKLLNQNP